MITWDEHGIPVSTMFDDSYFSKENGLEETRYVFCEGNHLPERFEQLPPHLPGTFRILETGFGTGLNFCCAWNLWQHKAPRTWQLHFISIEGYALNASDLTRALSLWPSLSNQAKQLIEIYALHPGINDFFFDDKRVRLTIIQAPIVEGFNHIPPNNKADAIFLDGFAPSKNPQMWSATVCAQLRKFSSSSTSFATFTAAGWVKENLIQAGFNVTRVKGYGHKKHMLIGQCL